MIFSSKILDSIFALLICSSLTILVEGYTLRDESNCPVNPFDVCGGCGIPEWRHLVFEQYATIRGPDECDVRIEWNWPYEESHPDDNPLLNFLSYYDDDGSIFNSGYEHQCVTCEYFELYGVRPSKSPYVNYTDSCGHFQRFQITQDCSSVTGTTATTTTVSSSTTILSTPTTTPQSVSESTTTSEPTTTPEPATTTPELAATTTPESAITTTPESEITTTPESAITTTPESAITTTPESAITTTPESAITTTPESAITTTPESAITTTPESAITTTPESGTTAPELATTTTELASTQEPLITPDLSTSEGAAETSTGGESTPIGITETLSVDSTASGETSETLAVDGSSTSGPTGTTVAGGNATWVPTETLVVDGSSTSVPTEATVAGGNATWVPTETLIVDESSTSEPTGTTVAGGNATWVPTGTLVVGGSSTSGPTGTTVAGGNATWVPTETLVVGGSSTSGPTGTTVASGNGTWVPTETLAVGGSSTTGPTGTTVAGGNATTTSTVSGITTTTLSGSECGVNEFCTACDLSVDEWSEPLITQEGITIDEDLCDVVLTWDADLEGLFDPRLTFNCIYAATGGYCNETAVIRCASCKTATLHNIKPSLGPFIQYGDNCGFADDFWIAQDCGTLGSTTEGPVPCPSPLTCQGCPDGLPSPSFIISGEVVDDSCDVTISWSWLNEPDFSTSNPRLTFQCVYGTTGSFCQDSVESACGSCGSVVFQNVIEEDEPFINFSSTCGGVGRLQIGSVCQYPGSYNVTMYRDHY